MKTKNKTSEESPWFDITKAFGYNALINMIISERGIGKTFSVKKWAFSKCLKKFKTFDDTPENMIFVRRFPYELENSFRVFSHSIAKFFPDYEFKDTKLDTYVRFRLEGEEDTEENRALNKWKKIAQLESIRWFKKSKGAADTENTTIIIFDEFLPEDGRYFQGSKDVSYFMTIAESYLRDKSNAKIILLANKTQLYNPYFEQLDILPDFTKEFTYKPGKTEDGSRGILLQMCPHGKYGKRKKSGYISELGGLLSTTNLSEMVTSDKFRDDDETLIERRTRNAIPLGCIQIDNKDISVWTDHHTSKLYYSRVEVGAGLSRYSFDATSPDYQSFRNLTGTLLFDSMVQAREKNLYRFEDAGIKTIVSNKLRGGIFL